MQRVLYYRTFIKFWLLLLTTLVMSSVQAAPPHTHEITYNARYDNFEAEASRYLRYDAKSSLYQLQTAISLDLLGQTITSLVETSQVQWIDDHPVPLLYEYRQEGLNTRSRSVKFDHQADTASFAVDDKKGTLALNGPVYDDLSSYLAIREQLNAGNTDIMFEVVDKDAIKTYHYQVDDEALVTTPLGKFTAVKLVRIRDDNPKRKTQIWLAKDYDYILVKLLQEEPDGHTIRLDITKAVFNGVALNPN
ncbi:MAG: DUF3108 domain-containing protein [Pseudomonadota bacterium]